MASLWVKENARNHLRLIYPALLARTETGGYVIRVPDVKGCVTTGDSVQDALDSIRDALAGCLCVLEDEGRPLPVASSPDSVAEECATVVLIDVYLIAYRQATDTHAVRKNVSLPAWLVYLADKNDINCSQLLQKAIKKELRIA